MSAWWADTLTAATGSEVAFVDIGIAGIPNQQHAPKLPEMLLIVEVTK